MTALHPYQPGSHPGRRASRKHAMWTWIATATLLSVLVTPALSQESSASVRRFILTVGANDGGPDRVGLRYALQDAESVAGVFQELGGVRQTDLIVLRDPDRATFIDGLDALAERVVAAKPSHRRVELFVYYSGHSDENGLLLGTERFEYIDLRKAVDELPADVRIVILDSCASGVLTRLKGGKRQASFLVDESTTMEGHAFLTSSSADEAAQESDRIEGSFFTKALVSGLRGAADASRDGRITLNEAYQYAFDQTLAHTEGTQSGPQHPAYDIQLAGEGDLVMTDLRGTSAGLALGEDMAGRLHVRDANDLLVVALSKTAGQRVELGLEPGNYRVMLDRAGDYYGGSLTLHENGTTELSMSRLAPVDPEMTVARGALPPIDTTTPVDDHIYKQLSVTLVPGLSTNGPDAKRTVSQLSLNGVGMSAGLRGVEFGYWGNILTEYAVGLQMAGIFNVVGGYIEGVQVAGVANTARDESKGVQFAGVLNSVQGRLQGIQAAGVINHAGRLDGMQLGVVNVAGRLDGFQAGVVNVGKTVNGVMLGVVNVADDADVTFGLLNIIRNGYHNIGVWQSDTAEGNVGIKLGSRHVYTIYAMGIESLEDVDRRRFVGLGIGMHVPGRFLFADLDLIGYSILENNEWQEDAHLLTKLRLTVGLPIVSRLTVMGGVAANLYVSEVHDGAEIVGDAPLWHDSFQHGSWVKAWPGFFFGLQL